MEPAPTTMPTFDWSAWPVVVVTYPNIASIEAVDRVFSELSAHHRGERFAIVGDLRPLRVATANARVRAAFAENVASEAHPRPVAEAAVLSGTVARGLVTAYQWLSPAPHPMRVFETVEEAVLWARTILDRNEA